MDSSAADTSSQSDTSLGNPVTLQRWASLSDFTPYGFRGYPFGTAHMRIDGLKVRSIHNRDVWYEVQGGLDIGRARIKSLGYGFRDDRFYGVIADPADYRSFLELKSTLDSVFGVPMKTDSLQAMITYLWNVPNEVVKLRIYWANRRIDDSRNDMILSLIATPILLDNATKSTADSSANPTSGSNPYPTP